MKLSIRLFGMLVCITLIVMFSSLAIDLFNSVPMHYTHEVNADYARTTIVGFTSCLNITMLFLIYWFIYGEQPEEA